MMFADFLVALIVASTAVILVCIFYASKGDF